MIHSVSNKDTKIAQTDSRRGSSQLCSEAKKEVLSMLEKRGLRNNPVSDITKIMSNGRLERQKQKLYEVKINSIECAIRFQTNRILELQSEVKELKEELRDDPDDFANRDMLIQTKEALPKIRVDKQELYNSWKTITSSDQTRRGVVNIACEEEGNVSVCTPSNTSICEILASKRARLISPLKIILSCDVGENRPSSEPTNVPNKSVY